MTIGSVFWTTIFYPSRFHCTRGLRTGDCVSPSPPFPSPQSPLPSPPPRMKTAASCTLITLSLESPSPGPRAYAAWIAVCLIWGTTYLAIRISLESIPPLLMAAIRWIAAGGLLIGGLALRGERLPRRGEWPALALLGILLLGFGNGAVVWAEQTVPSGLTAVLVATAPFWMVGIDALMAGGERLTLRRTLGLVLGFCGIVMLVWPEIRVGEGGRTFLGGVISAQVACIGWAVGSSYARRRGRGHAKEENVLASAAFEMFFGGIALLTVALLMH